MVRSSDWLGVAALGAGLCAGLGGASVACAQPAATDLGTLGIGDVAQMGTTLASGQVTWFRFELTAPVSASGLTWLDSDAAESLVTGDDTIIALYSGGGVLVASDDNDGPGSAGALSFGLGSGESLGADSLLSDGRDGASLSVGVYYLAVTAPPASFSGAWGVTTTHTASGNVEARVELGTWAAGSEEWSELAASPDAGELVSTAQSASGTGVLSKIHGVLTSGTDVDVYKIRVCDAAEFGVSLVAPVPGIGARFDTQLWLFDSSGRGLAHDDNTPISSGAVLSNAFVASNGEYYLAVSGWNRDAMSTGGQAMWNDEPVNVERAPDGPGASGTLGSWAGVGQFGGYRMLLSGACFVEDVPPGCPADLDDGTFTGTPDGGVTIDDLVYFLDAFAAGSEEADLDDDGMDPGTPDGGVTIDDLLYFLEHFTLGC